MKKAGIIKLVYDTVAGLVSGGGKKKARVRTGRRRRGKRGQGQLSIKKTVIGDRIETQCNSQSFPTITFELSDIPQYASYAALYDEFRINKVVVRYKTLTNVSSMYEAPGQITTTGFLHSVIDYGDSAPYSSFQSMANDGDYKCTVGTKDHVRTIYPKFLNVVGGSVQDQSMRGWLNCDNVNVSHYGLKLGFEGGKATSSAYTSFIVEPFITYYISFRNPK